MDIGIAQCSLTELVEDPLIGLLMKRDGVDRRGIEILFERIARERRRASSQPDSRAFLPPVPGREAASCQIR